MDMAALTGLQNCQSVDEIQRAIEKLQAARDRLVKDQQAPSQQQKEDNSEETGTEASSNGVTEGIAANGVENGGVDDKEELIDVSKVMENDGDESQWYVFCWNRK